MARDIDNHLLFEVATEVAHKVGGIYSVLKSKAPVTVAEYRERYTLLGPIMTQHKLKLKNCQLPTLISNKPLILCLPKVLDGFMVDG